MNSTLKKAQTIYGAAGFPLAGLAPATLAVLVQCAALVSVWGTVVATNAFTSQHFSIFSLVLLQSALAVVFCVLVRMAVWWRWIHFFFPLALFIMLMWQAPSKIYLIGFFVSLSLFWTTFRTQVPFFPSRPVVWEKVVEMMPLDKSVHMIEIGSGLGDLAMHLAKNRANSRIEGIEIAPLPWLISVIRSYITRSTAKFKLGDYYALDFSQYDMVFAYLSPAAMPALWEKASREMRTDSLLVSYEFDIPGVMPTFCVESGLKGIKIYVWKI